MLAVLLLLVALIVPVSSAGAAPSQAKQIKTLQKQMKTVRKQVKTLQKQVKTLQSQVKIVNTVAGINWSATVCTLAVVADNFQATWTALDNSGGVGTPFSALTTPLADYGACSDLNITRQTGLTLPSWTAYTGLIDLLYSP
jgi:prophage DNA circulation protein